jgi:hypothetical protein
MLSKAERDLIPEKKEKVIAAFNRTQLRLMETVIDNKDTTIARELGYTVAFVGNTISEYLEDKMEAVNRRVNAK